MSGSSLQHTLRTAQTLQRAGKLPQALQAYQRILRLLPHHAQANASAGAILIQLGNIEAALPHLERAARAQPLVTAQWIHWITALITLGNLAQARDAVEEARSHGLPAPVLNQLSALVETPPMRRQQGLVNQYNKGDHLLTEIAARMFMSDFPNHPLGYQILGSVQHDSRRFDEALCTKEDTVARFPNDANAHNNLSYTLLAMKRYEEALMAAQAAARLAPELAQAHEHIRQAQAGLETAVAQ